MHLLKIALIGLAIWPLAANAMGSSQHAAEPLFLALAIMIGGASLSWVVQKVRLPSVIGELLLGMGLGILAHYHYWQWATLLASPSLSLLAELGSILLLFEIGLESNVADIRKLGGYGVVSAIIGVVLPFALGCWLLPKLLGLNGDLKLALFLGATLAATSTGISARVFKDLKIIANPACQLVLTASIIDDILGLVILTVVSSLAVSGVVSIEQCLLIVSQVLVFIVVSVAMRRLIPHFLQQVLKINNEEAMVAAILIAFCLAWAYLAQTIGLATIIGAFIAGLVLEPRHFTQSQMPAWYRNLAKIAARLPEQSEMQQIKQQVLTTVAHDRLVGLVRPLNYVLVPIFFVHAGMQVDVITTANWSTLAGGLLITVIAIIGKLGCAISVPKTMNRWIVGIGMVPRGEIGLIFAMSGRLLGIFNEQVFAMILIMVVLTSLLPPLALQLIAKRSQHEN